MALAKHVGSHSVTFHPAIKLSLVVSAIPY